MIKDELYGIDFSDFKDKSIYRDMTTLTEDERRIMQKDLVLSCRSWKMDFLPENTKQLLECFHFKNNGIFLRNSEFDKIIKIEYKGEAIEYFDYGFGLISLYIPLDKDFDRSYNIVRVTYRDDE
jgi:hypothetical protein